MVGWGEVRAASSSPSLPNTVVGAWMGDVVDESFGDVKSIFSPMSLPTILLRAALMGMLRPNECRMGPSWDPAQSVEPPFLPVRTYV